jgi:hypothetical protein
VPISSGNTVPAGDHRSCGSVAPTPADRLVYIADLVTELSGMARGADRHGLARILDAAAVEARRDAANLLKLRVDGNKT